MSNVDQAAVPANNGKRPWVTPTVRQLDVRSDTRGGGGNIDDQDDVFYVIS